MSVEIGNWVRREGSSVLRVLDGTNPKWHLVESVIAEAAITRCGRRMEPTASRGELEVSEVEPLTRLIGQPQNCKRCSG